MVAMGSSYRPRGVTVVFTLAFASIIHAATPPYRCFGFLDSGHATIEPFGDIYRRVNESIEAYCLFDSDHLDVSNVSFVHWGREKQDQYDFTHEVVNKSAIKINVTPPIAETYSLKCDANGKHLCDRTVRVGYLPQNVENFSCISKNWRDLNCTWTVPYNPVTVQYSVTECPRFVRHGNWCYWPTDKFTLSVKHDWVLHLNATNKLKEDGEVFKYNIDIREIVLPNPVENLSAHVDGPNNVTLSWILHHDLDTFDCVLFEAAYREWHNGDAPGTMPWIVVDQWKVEPDRWTKETFNKTINNLHANWQYDFRVRVHTGFGEVRANMWSDAAILTKKTLAMQPTIAPKTTKGTFQVEEMQSHLEVYVYWQKVDQIYHNAPGFHYEVNVYDNDLNKRIFKRNEDVNVREAYAKFSNMDKDVSYRFEIIPENEEGKPSDENVEADVMVPKRENLLKVPSYFKVIAYSEANRTIYSLRWRIDEETKDVETVTLFWCKKNKYEERCLNKLEWEVVDNPSLKVRNLTHLEEKPLYMFGISLNSRSSSSGIKWITCIASHGNQPPPLEQFAITQVFPRHVVLEWSLDCKAKAAEPIGFNISYCSAPKGSHMCFGELMYKAIHDEAAMDYTVENLHPYSNYIFNIAILTEIGPSQWSKSESVMTKSDRPSGPPQQLGAIESGQTWTMLEWAPPRLSDRNGEIVKYEVSWFYGVKRYIDVANSSDVIQYNVTGLDSYTNYTFKVIPCTRVRISEVSCGIHEASLSSRTKIGVPSAVDDITQVDDIVKWDHDCTSGPNCSYELVYTVNSTEHRFKTKPYTADVNIRDLNLTCTEAESEIVIQLRAFTHNEVGQEVFGPAKEQTITCYLPGSKNYIPQTISNDVRVVVVQLPRNNQYNTFVNFAESPQNGDNVPSVISGSFEHLFEIRLDPIFQRWVKGSNKMSRENSNIKHLMSEDGVNGPSQTDIQEYAILAVDRMQENQEGDNTYASRRSDTDRSRSDLHNVRYFRSSHPISDSDRTPMGIGVHMGEDDVTLKDVNPNHLEMTGEQMSHKPNVYHVERYSPSLRNNQEVPHKVICPLLSLMKSPGTEVRMNASDTKFELNLKAAGNPYSILKSMYQHSVQDFSPIRGRRDYKSDVGSTGYDTRTVSLNEGDMHTHNGVTSLYALPEVEGSLSLKRDRRTVLAAGSPASHKQQRMSSPDKHIGSREIPVHPVVPPLDIGDGAQSASFKEEISRIEPRKLSKTAIEGSIGDSLLQQPFLSVEGEIKKDNQRPLPIHERRSLVASYLPPLEHHYDGLLEGNDNQGLTEPPKASQELKPASSIIYRVIGSFNGNVGNAASQRIEKRAHLISNTNNDRLSTNGIPSPPKESFVQDFQEKVSTRASTFPWKKTNPLNRPQLSSSRLDCPFVDLMNAKGTSVSFTSQGDGKFEFNLKGDGNFYDLLEHMHSGPARYESGTRKRGMDIVRGSRWMSRSVEPRSNTVDDMNNDEAGEVEMIYNRDGQILRMREDMKSDVSERIESKNGFPASNLNPVRNDDPSVFSPSDIEQSITNPEEYMEERILDYRENDTDERIQDYHDSTEERIRDYHEDNAEERIGDYRHNTEERMHDSHEDDVEDLMHDHHEKSTLPGTVYPDSDIRIDLSRENSEIIPVKPVLLYPGQLMNAAVKQGSEEYRHVTVPPYIWNSRGIKSDSSKIILPQESVTEVSIATVSDQPYLSVSSTKGLE